MRDAVDKIGLQVRFSRQSEAVAWKSLNFPSTHPMGNVDSRLNEGVRHES